MNYLKSVSLTFEMLSDLLQLSFEKNSKYLKISVVSIS